MLRIFTAYDHHNAIAPDHLAMLTTRFDRGTYFHELALHIYRQNVPKRDRQTLQPLRDISYLSPACHSHHLLNAIHIAEIFSEELGRVRINFPLPHYLARHVIRPRVKS
jgi:hypothetical protein